MNIQSHQLDLQFIAEGFNPPAPRDESKVHVTELRDALLETLGLLTVEEELPDWVRNLGSFGLIWEKVLHKTIEDSVGRIEPLDEQGDSSHWWMPGTIQREMDGVLGSLDGQIMLGAKPVAVWECKTRWKAEELPIENDKYMIQAKAYCWMAGVSQCWFPVLNIAARPPNMIQWLHIIDFTAQELMENWQSLMRMKPMVERRKYEHIEQHSA